MDRKFYGLYKMIELIGKQAYKLKSLQTMKIHDIFYVSLLELYDEAYVGGIPPSLPISVEGKNKYEVEKIFDSRSHYSKLQYFVK